MENQNVMDRQTIQTWKEFQNKYRGSSIVMFGVGQLSYDFFANTDMKLSMVVDNDVRKQGKRLSDFLGDCASGRSAAATELVIQNPEAVKQLRSGPCAAIIACRRADAVRPQLMDLGVSEIYSTIDLNCNSRVPQEHLFDGVDIKKDKIVVSTAAFGGHGYYISRALLSMRRDLDIVWILKHPQHPRQEIPDGVRCVYESNRPRYLYEMATSRIWIYDELIPEYVAKKEGQIYIQVKHWSSVTLKNFYMEDALFPLQKQYRDKFLHNAEIMDYIVSGSSFDEESCKRGFNFNGKFLRMGSPRSDILFGKDEKERIKTRLGLHNQIALYAPTWRYSNWTPDLDYLPVLNALKERFGGKWCFIVKLHPNTPITARKLADGVLDLSAYENAQELIAAADIVITDYSSLMFEPAYVGKPVFLYASDRTEYIDQERQLLIDYDTLPFSFAGTNVALQENILHFNETQYREQVENFLKKYGVAEDGHASERVAKWILDAIS